MTNPNSQTHSCDKKTSNQYPLPISEAQLLIRYLCKNGKASNKSISAIETIAKIQKNPDSKQIAEFWNAYNTLANQVKPATVETIKVNITPIKKNFLYALFNHNKVTLPKVIIFRYSSSAFILLALILLLQVYWLLGSGIIQQITKSEAELTAQQLKMDALSNEINHLYDMRKDINSEATKSTLTINIESREKARQFEKLEEKRQIIATRTHTLYVTLEDTTLHLSDHALDQVEDPYVLYFEFQKLINEFVFRYILPLLLGALGACVNILRRISIQIQNSTFSPDSGIRFLLRFCLGMIAGLTFSWLFQVNTTNTTITLSPLAVAFVVGYSVEILFTGLDKVISSLTGKTAIEEDVEAGKS